MNGASGVADELGRINEIPFPEFTSKLISDTFDATVSSMIRQQEAYADLLDQVAASIEQFETQNVGNTEIRNWLGVNGPTEDGASTIGTPEDPGSLDSDATDVIEAKLSGPMRELDVESLPTGNLDENEVQLIYSLVRRKIARPRQESLEELVEQGMVRLVVDEGTIETKLEFEVEGRDTEEVTERDYERTSGGIGGSGRLLSSIIGVGVSGSYQKIDVSTRREQRESDLEAAGEIMGRVELNLRGDYQPLRAPEEEAEEAEPDRPA